MVFNCIAKGRSSSRTWVTPSVCPFVCPSITQCLSTQLLWNYSTEIPETWYVVRTSCSCSYCQEFLIPQFLWKLCPFELGNLLKFMYQRVIATSLKLLDRNSWNLVYSKNIICSCAHYQEIVIPQFVLEFCPFELWNLLKILMYQLVITNQLKHWTEFHKTCSKNTICCLANYQEILIL